MYFLASSSRFRVMLAICLAAIAPGCAVTSVDGERMRPGSDAFSSYVEAVFRRQNEVATALSFALDDEMPNTPRFEALEAAETELLTTCRGLNELARRRRDGASLNGMGALRRAREAPACERAAAAAAALLP